MDDFEKRKIIDKYHRLYRHKPMPLCNECFTSKFMIPCAYGIPNKDLGFYAKAGFVKLLGLDFSTRDGQLRHAFCKQCEEFMYDT